MVVVRAARVGHVRGIQPEESEMTESKRQSRRMMLLLMALFLLPPVVAAVLYYGHWRPSGNSNHGELLQPIRQAPAFTEPLRGKWALAWVVDGA
jgi:hypothetical protein